MIPEPASAKPQGQHVAAVSDEGTQRASAVKQTAITDFFSLRPPTSYTSDSTRRVYTTPTFITPCPSVRLAGVPAVFQVQSECAVEDYLDPTHPLFEHEISKSASELPEAATERATNLGRLRSGSTPNLTATWHDRTASGSSKDERIFSDSVRLSESSYHTPKVSGKEQVSFEISSWPNESAATTSSGAFPAEKDEKDDAVAEIEENWIKKDDERLAFIANMKKEKAETDEELANTFKAFQMASEANIKLQAELKKKSASLSQTEEEINELVHSLNVADMNKETLDKELVHIRKIQVETESENDCLETQLKERCDSVARLTETLSRVADFDRWEDVRRELEQLVIQAGCLPQQLNSALLECDDWKKKHNTIDEEHEKLLSEHEELLSKQASLSKNWKRSRHLI